MKSTNKAILIFLSLFPLIACNPINQENFDKIKAGQQYSETVNILGKADSCDSLLSAKNCSWVSDEKRINITFVNNEVVLFSGSNL